MAWQGNGAENSGMGAAGDNAGGRVGGPNNGQFYRSGYQAQANTNYYKAKPGYTVAFRKGEPVQVPTGPGGTTLIKQGPK